MCLGALPRGEGSGARARPANGIERCGRRISLWEHVFVTSQGSAYARFRRALDRGQVTNAIAAATELPRVSLADALELCMLLAVTSDPRFDGAARRWLSLFADKAANGVEEVAMAGAAFTVLGRDPESDVARGTLEALLDSATS
jgi:hypothetical protein